MAKPTEYALTSSHPEDIDSGRVLAPGDRVALSDVDVVGPRAKDLIDRGLLVALSGAAGPTKEDLLKRAAELEIEGRSSMTKDELGEAIAEAVRSDNTKES